MPGKFSEYVKQTTYDPAVGYPIEIADGSEAPTSGSVFDNADNPLTLTSNASTQDQRDGTDVMGLGGVGGGDGFYEGGRDEADGP